MVFFYHHYELPAILRQAHQTHYPTRLPTTRQARGGSAPPDPTPSPAPHPNPEQSSVPPPPTNNPPLTTPTPSTPLISSSSPLSPTTRPHWSTSTRVAPVITETSSSSDVPLAPTIFNRVSPENVASLLLQNGRGGAESSPQDVAPTIFNHRGESSLLRAGQSGGGESNTACNRVSSGGVNNNECNPTPKVHHDVVVTQEETPLPPTSNPAQITTSPNFSESQSHHDQGNLGGVVNASGISSSGLLSPHQDGDGLRHRFPTSDAPADGEGKREKKKVWAN
ncbi:hypothetical protein Fcan01_22375 [Folsomia candida]|uniref:Uncharacterized protein n=1 Tax=Folsomia candida TaxID=158441 RepID=A0A226DEI3_FOLCA|nr:hypothetical protein Fcan01_22375 [Folsomia candida]